MDIIDEPDRPSHGRPADPTPTHASRPRAFSQNLARLIVHLGHGHTVVPMFATTSVPRCRGAEVPRCRGAEVPRCRGAEVPRCRGAEVPRCRGAEVPRCRGAEVPRCRGAEVPRCRGAEVPRCRGAEVPTCRDAETCMRSPNRAQPQTMITCSLRRLDACLSERNSHDL